MADEVPRRVEVTATVGPTAQLEASDITARPRTRTDPLAGLNFGSRGRASTRLDGPALSPLRGSGRRVTFRRKRHGITS